MMANPLALAIGILSLIVQPVALAPRCQPASRPPPERGTGRCLGSVENPLRKFLRPSFIPLQPAEDLTFAEDIFCNPLL